MTNDATGNHAIRLVEPRDHAGAVLALFERNNEDATHPRLVLAEGRCELWLALAGVAVIGILLGTHAYVRNGAPYAGIENLLVDRPRRHLGLGRALMRTAEAHYRATGMAGVQLAADAGNAAAVSLYESLGYGVTRRYVRVRDGREEPRIQMVKTFGTTEP